MGENLKLQEKEPTNQMCQKEEGVLLNQEQKTVNELKKEYLHGYRGHVRRIKRIRAELSEIREMKSSISVSQDGMPHGSSCQGDLSGYAAMLDSLERELIEERYQRIVTYIDISKRIERLKSENEKDVLFYRYIKGMEWYEIAEEMKYSERQIHRYHGKALAHIDVPEDVIECQ